jgi:hypothetical protein
MAVFTYTAKRSVIAGHTAGLSYSLEIGVQTLSPTQNRRSNTKTALDGVTSQTRLHNIVKGWSINTAFIDLDPTEELPEEWVEFIDSVSGGETFQLDALGTIATPNNLVSVKLRAQSQPSLARVENQQVMTQRIEVINL